MLCEKCASMTSGFLDIRLMERSVQSDQFIVWNGIQNATEAVAGVPLIVCQHPAYPVGVAALIAPQPVPAHRVRSFAP